jgi:hypothetical protein
MKYAYLPLAAALVLTGCGQNTTTEQPAATTAPAPAAPAEQPAAPADSAAAPPDATATEPKLTTAAPSQTITAAFDFKPVKDADNPSAKRSSAHLLLSGKKPQDIDLGHFTGKPDVVNAEKAKLANFPADMLMGFRAYDPNSGVSSDLAVLNVGGHHLRIVQRRVNEEAAAPGQFETAREIPIPAGTMVVKK